jgi:predicted ArsR family transcriptional regulator
MDHKDLIKQLESLAAIEDPVRRKLYLYVVSQAEEITRDAAARAVKVSRELAAFHLDKLVKAGLLETSFRRLSQRSGPGAGRPSKLYRRSASRFEVTLPPRRYELAARVLADTLGEIPADQRVEILESRAREWGARLAQDPSMRKARGLPLHRAMVALQICGFEPLQTREGEIVLRNCPFDSLRENCREMICGMNLALIRGLLAGLELDEVQANLAPRPGMCCVALEGPSSSGKSERAHRADP